jgi:hypothetical protein
VIAIMSDGTTKDLGIKSDTFNKSIATTIKNMAGENFNFKNLPEAEKREKAIERLTGGTGAPKTGDNKPGESSASSSAVAKPKTQAEFDKLPPGALYVNPKDGKTYSKNDPKK